jgi:catechol 2,3-dioxygenase-like lactoylglutathione lyase family enzyme
VAAEGGRVGALVGVIMIDHVSIAVRDLAAGAKFYEDVLGAVGYAKLADRSHTVGFGKTYPEFWLNHRPGMERVASDTGVHVCVRASSPAAVDAFHAAALRSGATCDGPPGFRPHRTDSYYAAFIRDADGNRIEAVTFVQSVQKDAS